MKIENGLLFLAPMSLHGPDEAVQPIVKVSALCIPLRNVSHLEECLYSGVAYTALILSNGDEVKVSASISDLLQLIKEAHVMHIFGSVVPAGPNLFPNPEVLIKGTRMSGSDLKMIIDRNAKRNEGPTSFAKGGIAYDPEVTAIV